MGTITLSEKIYQLLQRKARDSARTPDELAEALLHQHLMSEHTHIDIIEKPAGPQAMIKGSRVPVSMVVGYVRMGYTPEDLVREIWPHLTLAQIYDALSYYYDHRDEIEQEISESTEEYSKTHLQKLLREEDYLRITGRAS